MAGKAWFDEVPGKLKKMEVVHKIALAPMLKPILGAVLHTTDDKVSMPTLEAHRNDFAASGPPREPLQRSAHFMIDRDGLIAQFRSLDQGAAHFSGRWFQKYIGIEHIAAWKGTDAAGEAERLTSDQIDASADLLNVLKSELGITLSELSDPKVPGAHGIGRHKQFEGTNCGLGSLTEKGTFGPGPDFKKILANTLERSPVGTWEVRVGDWTWIYTFKIGSAEWRPFDVSKPSYQGTGGTGTWDRPDEGKGDTLTITWSGGSFIGSVEKWDLPLSSSGQTGKLVKQGGGVQAGDTKISARRID